MSDVITLPQSVYDSLANPALPVVNLPEGTFALPKPLLVKRSNVTVNFGGCTLGIDPTQSQWLGGCYPIQVLSESKKVVFGTSVSGAARRTLSHITGVISPTTTQLTMAPDEIVDVQPGETVLIWAGVSKFDPVEPYVFLPATVRSVDMSSGIVTFVEPLAWDVPDYGDTTDLKAIVEKSSWDKIGEWGTFYGDSNFSKGFGTDHGMERFTEGMTGNITLNGITLNLTPVLSEQTNSVPNGAWMLSATAVSNLTINGLSINNPLGSCFHSWRSFGCKVNDVFITGQGLSKLWNTWYHDAYAFTAWGGRGLECNRTKVIGKDISMFNTEVGAADTVVNDLDYNVEFTSARNAPTSSVVFGFYGSANYPVLSNLKIAVKTTGGGKAKYFSYQACRFRGRINFGKLINSLDLAYQRANDWGEDCTVIINNREFGPPQTSLHTARVRAGTPARLVIHKGLYIAGRVRVKTPGGLMWISDTFGNYYWADGSPGTPKGMVLGSKEWQPFNPSHWSAIQIEGKGNWKEYIAKWIICSFRPGALASASVEVEYTYLPLKKSRFASMA